MDSETVLTLGMWIGGILGFLLGYVVRSAIEDITRAWRERKIKRSLA